MLCAKLIPSLRFAVGRSHNEMETSRVESELMESPVLDYTDYVEFFYEEEDGVLRHCPSAADVTRTAYRFLNPLDIPPDPFAVPYGYYEKILRRFTEYESSRYEIFGQWYHYRKCPFCKFDLENSTETGNLADSTIEVITVRLCPNCGWWDFEEELPVEKIDAESYRAKSVHRRAVLREYSVAGSEAPIESLRQYIVRHPDQLPDLNPKQLEKLVGAVFSEFMNCEAVHVGGPNDKGIDVILIDGVRRYVIQVKRRQAQRQAEGVSGIREFLGAMVLDGAVRGLFVSTASRFSPNAVTTTRKAQKLGIIQYINLVNAQRLIEICKLTASQSQPTWKRYTSKPDQLSNHVTAGHSTFMELAMGHPDWRLS